MRRAENRLKPDCYTEKHHIFPVGIFGKNKRTVILTAREHYIAHALLEKAYITRYGKSDKRTLKMISAFYLMNMVNGRGQHRYTNSRLFEAHKLRYIESRTGENNCLFGKKRIFTEEWKENIRKGRVSQKGMKRSAQARENIRAGKQNTSNETKQKISTSRKGMIFSDSHKENLKLSHLGNEPSNKNNSRTIYEVTDPEGNIEITNKLRSYCEARNLLMASLMVVAVGKRNQCKGYKVKIVSKDGLVSGGVTSL